MKTILLLLFTSFYLISIGQANCISIDFPKTEVMYTHVKNEIKINGIGDLSNYKFEHSAGASLTFAIANNKIYAYTTRPSFKKQIKIYVINNQGDTIFTKAVEIKRIPDPNAFFLGQQSGLVSPGKLAVGRGLNAKFEGFNFDITPNIISFEVGFISSSGKYELYINNDPNGYFVPEVKEALSKVVAGDRVFFTRIKVNMSGNESRVISPILLMVR